MSLDRYLKDEEGFRKYVELMESMPTAKRQALMQAASRENAFFVETASKYILTFERITRLPELELTEVLGASDLKPQTIAVAINSVTDASTREKLIKHIPRNQMPAILQEISETQDPKPFDIGSARLQMIKKTRELEKEGKLESVQIPRFARGHFQKKTA